MGREVHYHVSLTGIDCGVKAVSRGDDYDVYALHEGDSVKSLRKIDSDFSMVFPSSTTPTNLKNAAPKNKNIIVCRGKKVEFQGPTKSWDNHSTIWVYRDLFLLFDHTYKCWVLARIVVPSEGAQTESQTDSKTEVPEGIQAEFYLDTPVEPQKEIPRDHKKCSVM